MNPGKATDTMNIIPCFCSRDININPQLQITSIFDAMNYLYNSIPLIDVR